MGQTKESAGGSTVCFPDEGWWTPTGKRVAGSNHWLRGLRGLCSTQAPAGGHCWRWDLGWALGHLLEKPAKQGLSIPFAGGGQSWGEHRL